MGSENDSEEEEDIIDLFNNIFDDPDDIVNNVFEQNDNYHPPDNNVDGQDLDMADEGDNDQNRVPEGWASNKWKQGDCNMIWLPEFTRDKSFLTDIPNEADELFLRMFYKALQMKQTSMQKLFSQRRRILCHSIQDSNNGKDDSISLKDMYSLP